jgi:hypothetical protein
LLQEFEGPAEPGAPQAGPDRRLREARIPLPLAGLFHTPTPGAYAPDVRVSTGELEVSPPSQRLLAREVAPGVIVLLDPTQVPNPEGLIKRLTRALGERDGEGT